MKILLSILIQVSFLQFAHGKGSSLLAELNLNSFTCLTPELFNKQVEDFSIQLETFDQAYACEKNNELFKVSSALFLIENLSFENQVSFNFIEDLKQTEFVNYLKEELKKHGGIMRADLGCGMFAIACADPKLGLMTIGSAAFDEQTSVFDVAATLLHETRHLQSEKFKHVACNNTYASRMGEYACDENIAEQGAYGVELQFYLKSAFAAKNFARSSQVANRLSAYAISRMSFNQHPLQSSEVLMLQSAEDELYFYDGENLFATGMKFPNSQVFVNTEGLTEPIFRVLYDSKEQNPIAFLFRPGMDIKDFESDRVQDVILGKTLLGYKAKDSANREKIYDYAFFNLDMYTGWAVTLTEKTVSISPPDYQDYEVALPAKDAQVGSPNKQLIRIAHHNICKSNSGSELRETDVSESKGDIGSDNEGRELNSLDISFVDEDGGVYPYTLGGSKTEQVLKQECKLGKSVMNHLLFRNQILRLMKDGRIQVWAVDRFSSIKLLDSKAWKRAVPIPYMPSVFYSHLTK